MSCEEQQGSLRSSIIITSVVPPVLILAHLVSLHCHHQFSTRRSKHHRQSLQLLSVILSDAQFCFSLWSHPCKFFYTAGIKLFPRLATAYDMQDMQDTCPRVQGDNQAGVLALSLAPGSLLQLQGLQLSQPRGYFETFKMSNQLQILQRQRIPPQYLITRSFKTACNL